MKPFILLLVGVVAGWAASGVDWNRKAVAQQDEAPSFALQNPDPGGIGNPGPELKQKIAEWTKGAAEYAQINRYQISASGNTGAYVVDSVTGKVWRVIPNVKPELVADSLPQK